MPLPDLKSTTSLFKSSEQVVPISNEVLEGSQCMEADLPTEAGTSSLGQIPIMETENVEEQTQDPIHTVTETKIIEDSEFGESVQHCNLLQEGQTSNYPIKQEEESHLLEQYSLDIDEDTNQLGPPQYFQYNTSQQWPLQLEGEADMGYSSHSACSSCQQGSQADSGQNNLNYPDVDYTEECFNGDEEMEDLLFHFHRFFKNRYEEILTEQEMHVRQIVKKVIKTCNDKDCFNEAVEVTDKATQTDEIKKFTVPSVIINDSTYKACNRLEDQDQTSLRNSSTDSIRHAIMQKDKLLQRVTSLTCDITSLLQRKEYKI